jgi:hypothetical protein
LYYSTFWWGGVPYYYADDNYYQWNGDVGQYETVQPPADLAAEVQSQQPAVGELYMYPKTGQSPEQQAQDRSECHRWAAGQSGFDPAASRSNATAGAAAARPANFMRADAACLEARGYSVR